MAERSINKELTEEIRLPDQVECELKSSAGRDLNHGIGWQARGRQELNITVRDRLKSQREIACAGGVGPIRESSAQVGYRDQNATQRILAWAELATVLEIT